MVATGDIVIGGTFNEGVLQVKLTRAMAPTSRLVVYYVKEDNEIVADGLNLVIDEIFQNKVEVLFFFWLHFNLGGNKAIVADQKELLTF